MFINGDSGDCKLEYENTGVGGLGLYWRIEIPWDEIIVDKRWYVLKLNAFLDGNDLIMFTYLLIIKFIISNNFVILIFSIILILNWK